MPRRATASPQGSGGRRARRGPGRGLMARAVLSSTGILLVAVLALLGPYVPALVARLRGQGAPARRFAVADEVD